MNYIYDIILNFQEVIYDFYEWNQTDSISHIRKIPVFKVNSRDLYTIWNYDVIFDTSFLEKIKNKTEIFAGKSIKNLEYAFLLCDGINVLATKVDKNHNLFSKLLLEEEMEVTESISRVKEMDISYHIKQPKKEVSFLTREEVERENYVKNELKLLEKRGETEKLEYLYFECFGEKDFNMKKLYQSSTYPKLYQVLKLIQINK